MHVVVKLFAGLRELAGTGERRLELPDGATIDDVWPTLGLGERPCDFLYAVNHDYVEPGVALAEGDEVALIPPVSGGAFRLTDEPLDVGAVVAEVTVPEAGGIASFVGTVRAQSRGRSVHYLDYEGYAGMAEKVMAELAAELKRTYE